MISALVVLVLLAALAGGIGMAMWYTGLQGRQGRRSLGQGGGGYPGQTGGRQQQQGRQALPAGPPKDPNAERSLQNLFVGDVVMYLDQDFMVEAHYLYDDGGWTWDDYKLVDGPQVCYMTVEEDDELEVSLNWVVDDLEVSLPLPNVIEYRGDTYRRRETGKAKVYKVGEAEEKPDRCRYFEYQGPDGRTLGIEDYDGDIEVSVGEMVAPSSISFLPGSPELVGDGGRSKRKALKGRPGGGGGGGGGRRRYHA